MTVERWNQLSLGMQMMNIESELARAESLQQKNDPGHARACLFRALELAQLSAFGSAPKGQKKEMRRVFELIADLSQNKREYTESLAQLRRVLQPFAQLVAKERGV